MRLSSLGSGSNGNATLVELGRVCIMIDCGFGLKDTVARLERVDRVPSDIDAILVTHEHSDHIGGVEAFAHRFNIQVYMTEGTARAWRSKGRVAPKLIRAESDFLIGEVEIRPVAVPHDAREPVQFVFQQSGTKIGVLTDLGSITPHVVANYLDCQALLIEANHDVDMLANGPYPYRLKQRVSGPWGHLNNNQAAELLHRINVNKRLQHLVIGHISQKNNSSELAAAAISEQAKSVGQVLYAEQDEPLGWMEIY